MMTLERLAEIEKRANAATPGPIEADAGNNLITLNPLPGELYKRQICEFPLDARGRNDSEFYAHARTDIPELIAEIRRLREALAIYSETHVWVLATAMVKNGDKGFKLWEKLGKDATEALNPKERP